MKFLKEQYHKDAVFFRSELRLYLRNAIIAFIAIILIVYAASLFLPDILNALVAYMQAVIENADIVTDDGGFSALNIFGNNLRASIMGTVFGCIPFLYLTALPIGLNAAVLGAMAAYYQVNGQSLLLLAVGIVPHGIFEIPALLIAFACGLYLCRELTRRILGRQEAFPPLSNVFLSIVRVYLTLVIPLLIIAALVEAYITPLCINALL